MLRAATALSLTSVVVAGRADAAGHLATAVARGARELPFSSQLSEERRDGVYRCTGCDRALFESRAKYFTSTGWPTFSGAIAGAMSVASILPPGGDPLHCGGCYRVLGDVLPVGEDRRFSIDGRMMRFELTRPPRD